MKPVHYALFGKTYSPFTEERFERDRLEKGFARASLLRADLIITRSLKHASFAARIFPLQDVMVWTHEPSYDYTMQSKVRRFFGKNILVLNVYTGNVFWHNRHFLGSYHYDVGVDLGLEHELLTPQVPREDEW